MIRKLLYILAPVAAVWLAALSIATVLCGIADLDEGRRMLSLGGGAGIPLHLLAGLVLSAAALLTVLRVGRPGVPARQTLVQSEDVRDGVSPRLAALIARLERRAARDLPAYRRRVLAVALLGHGFVLAVFALLAATLLGAVPALLEAQAPSSLEVAIGAVAVAASAFAALRARVPLPDGERIRRADAPALFECLDALRARLGGPRLHEVLITEDFNAAIVQRPRLGLLGWPRNHLLIGLPLMQALTREQFEAVLAHEYAHAAHADGRFAAWVYRARRSWLRLSGDAEAGGPWHGFLFGRFFDWYAPWFNAYSFVLARQSELAADAAAAAATSPRIMVDALVAVALRGRQLETAFWPNFYDGARYEPAPPPVYRALGIALKESLAPDAAEAHLRAALARRTGPRDTHPALDRRARALGQDVRLPPAPVVSSAEALLGRALERLLERCDARWGRRCGAAWRDTYAEAERERTLLGELDARAAAGTLSIEERWCRARLTETAQDQSAAELLYREILARAGQHAPSHFALARLMFERDEAWAALGHLERAMAADEEAELPGCELASIHLERLGWTLEASVYRLRLVAARRERDEARDERNRIGLDDEVAPPRLTAGDVERVRRVLDAETAVAQAWLVRKVLRREDGLQSLILIVSFEPTVARIVSPMPSRRCACRASSGSCRRTPSTRRCANAPAPFRAARSSRAAGCARVHEPLRPPGSASIPEDSGFLSFDPARLTVLVLDDQFERRAALRATLGRIGVEKVRLAADEAEAIERLRAERVDALVIDDAFGAGAVEFITRIRQKTRGHVQEIAIVLCVTADNARVKAARDAGVTEMIAKPATAEALRVRLEEIVLRPRPFIRAAGYVGPCRRRRRALDWPFAERRGGPVANENNSPIAGGPLPSTARGA